MAKSKKVKEVKVISEQVAPVEGEKGTASVYSKGKEFIRTYSKEAHGSDYKKLAEGFAKKIGGEVR